MEDNKEKKIKKSKAGIYLAGLLIFVGIILLCMGSSNNNYNRISEQWEWHLTTGDWNEVTFTSVQLIAVGSSDIEDVFESVIDYLEHVLWYNEATEHWEGWVAGEPHNSLTDIIPGDYYVQVSQDCVLTIGSEDLPPDIPPYVEIETDSWVASASGILCILSGIGVFVKTKWM